MILKVRLRSQKRAVKTHHLRVQPIEMQTVKIVNEQQFNWDLGLSAYTIDGNQFNTGLFAYTDMQIKPNAYFILGFRPSVGQINNNTITDIKSSFGLNYFKNLTSRIGYRIIKTPNGALHGPFAGIEFRF